MLLFSSAYNEYTVISKEYTGPLYFDITGVNCIGFLPNFGIFGFLILKGEIGLFPYIHGTELSNSVRNHFLQKIYNKPM